MNNNKRREVNSLLNYSDDIVFTDEVNGDEDDRKNRHDNREKHKDSNSYNSRDNRNWDNRNKKDNNNKTWNNPVDKIIREQQVYDKNCIYKTLVKQDGLYKMLKDLKEWSKNPKHKKPNYIYYVLRDIVVAAALPDAIDNILKEKKYDLEKKDFELLMDEILLVIRNSNDDPKLNENYSKESIEAMREAYVSILYKFNKKKVKKFKEINVDEGVSKKLVVLTAGKNPNNSIYSVLKFLYNNSDKIEMTEKMLLKIFKICYGKDSLSTVIKCIMGEKVNPMQQTSPFLNSAYNENKNDSEMYVLIDKLMRDQLESMNKKDLEKTILEYVKDRKIAKKRGDNIKRRFNRKSIHPEDYPKLTKAIEKLENDDFSIIEYLR